MVEYHRIGIQENGRDAFNKLRISIASKSKRVAVVVVVVAFDGQKVNSLAAARAHCVRRHRPIRGRRRRNTISGSQIKLVVCEQTGAADEQSQQFATKQQLLGQRAKGIANVRACCT